MAKETNASVADAGPVEGPWDLPGGWHWARLSDVTERSQYGWTTKASSTGDVRFLRTTDISSGRVNWATVPFCAEAPSELDRYLIREGDILISRAGSVGKSFLVEAPDEAVFASYLIRFRPREEPRFVYWWLQTSYYWSQIAEQSAGIAIPNVNASKLNNLLIPVPPSDTQRSIVARIDELFIELDDGEFALERARDDLETYRKSLLKAAVTGELTADWRAANPRQETGGQLLQRILADRKARWEADPKNKGKRYKEPIQPDLESVPPLPTDWTWCSLEQLSSPMPHSISDGPFGSNLKSEHYREEGPRVIRLQNIGKRGEFVDAKAHIAVDHFDTLERHHVRPGDLVVAILGEPLPKAMIVPDDFGEGLVKADCIKVRLADDGLAPFVWSVLNSPMAHSLMSHLVKRVGRPRIGMAQIKSMPIPLPPLTEITEIAETLAAGLKQAADGEGKISDYLLLSECARRSILSTAFKGELGQ